MNVHSNLGAGVLRLGGNKVELTQWQRSGSAAQSEKGHYTVTPAHVDQLYAFANVIHWKVIHGVNLASNQPELSADEIAYAMQVGAKSVLAFEIGNEPDHYDKDTKNLRAKGYNYALYKDELEAALRVIEAKTPKP